jgi:hypothetical protein
MKAIASFYRTDPPLLLSLCMSVSVTGLTNYWPVDGFELLAKLYPRMASTSPSRNPMSMYLQPLIRSSATVWMR